nr:unnamed protein product [Callosobruchus chinensis]
MKKIKNGDAIALEKTEQKNFSKKTKKLKEKIKTGEIKIIEKRKKKQRLSAEKKRGLIYIGHIPHGFYEDEMKNYFKQFGKVTNVKLCRSSKTGQSKGFGYVEFLHQEVAKIAAETMNNYLMFKKRIVAEYVPYEKRPKHIFHGKSTTEERFSSKSRRQKQFNSLNRPVAEQTHIKRVNSRVKKLNKKLEKLHSMGIEANFEVKGKESVKREHVEAGDGITETKRFSSDIDVKIPLKKSRKSVNASNEARTSKSDSDKIGQELSVKKSATSTKSSRSVNKPMRVDKSTSVDTIIKGRSDGKLKQKKHGVTKRARKPTPLNSETVKKIARELIRKQGSSLVTYVTPGNKKTGRKKSKSEKA